MQYREEPKRQGRPAAAFRAVALLRRSPAARLALGAFLFLAATSRGFISVCDTEVRYRVARQIWHEGTIYLPTTLLDDGVERPVTFTHDGKLIGVYELASSVGMLPGIVIADLATRHLPPAPREEYSYLIGQFVYKVVLLPAMATLLVLGVHLLCVRLGMTVRQALWTAFASLFGTFLLFYARSCGLELEVACVFLWALLVYVGGPSRSARVLVASALFGLTFHYRAEFVIPVALTMTVMAYARLRQKTLSLRFLVELGTPAFLFGLLILYHNYVRTGNPFANAYTVWTAAHAEVPVFGSYPFQYFLPAFFGLAKGFLWYSPVFLLAALLLVPKCRTLHPALRWGSIPCAGLVCFVTSMEWVITEGAWGPRYLAPITPFVAIALSLALAPAFRAHTLARAAAGFVLLCALLQLCVCLDDHHFEASKFLKAREVLAARGDRDGLAALEGWRSSFLLGRLRTLGVPLGDPPVLRELWHSPELRAFDKGLRGNVWWLKLGDKFGWSRRAWTLAVCGAAAAAAGLVLMGLALGRAPRENVVMNAAGARTT